MLPCPYISKGPRGWWAETDESHGRLWATCASGQARCGLCLSDLWLNLFFFIWLNLLQPRARLMIFLYITPLVLFFWQHFLRLLIQALTRLFNHVNSFFSPENHVNLFF